MKKSILTTLITSVFFFSATAATEDLSTTQQDNLKQINTILEENPQLIDGLLTSLNMYINQEQQRANAMTTHHDWLYNNDAHSSFGAEKPALTIVNFTDYNCPFCKRLDSVLHQLVADFPMLNVINVYVPLQQREVVGLDTNSAEFALNVWQNERDAYPEVHKYLIGKSGRHDKSSLERVAKVTNTESELKTNDEVEKIISMNYRVFSELGFGGTPAMIIGDEIINGYVPLDKLKPIIEAELEESDA
ncbi:DsbA family protein [Vibrio sp. Of7-15]|uniref:DsbA family protein n=1 Tax=Vibrio sp. Of7-15 TaxID=2724879 RepID=UPI001EF16EC4|nr:DsbA family protein [Vibrio sp. Of7-15]MCG7495375.1 DsbA family protein [Vibrio sp. Of7-15]